MLASKIASFRLSVDSATRLLEFWEKQIAEHGESKATAFYTHLGLNHLEKKSFEWEGLTLSREPKEHEKLCVKGISQAQDSGKASVSKVLLESRTVLIDQAMKGIRKLSPATYHELILTMPSEQSEALQTELSGIFRKGRRLVAQELSKTKADFDFSDVPDDLDEFIDLTDGRIINEIQARVIAATARNRLTSELEGAEFWAAVEKEVAEQSTGWVEKIATGVANKVLNDGRTAEAEVRSEDWETVEYSALLDPNVCDPCSADDGQTSTNESDLTPAPNPDCAGGEWCRCVHVYISD